MALSVISDRELLISKKLDDICLEIIFDYLSDNDLIISGKVDPKLNEVVHHILHRKRELKLEYDDDYKDDILEAIKIAGNNLQTLCIEGRLDSDFFEVIHVYCRSIKTLDLDLHESNPFRINPNLIELQNLKLTWNHGFKPISDDMKNVIQDLLNESSKLQNLHLIGFEERELKELGFPSSLKGLIIDSVFKHLYAEDLLKKIQWECKEIEKIGLLRLFIKGREGFDALMQMGRNCPNIQHLNLSFEVYRYRDVSFLSEFPNLKELYLRSYYLGRKIDLFQLSSLVPNIETLHLDGLVIKKLKKASLSNLKNFGFECSQNKDEVQQNLEKFNSLRKITFYDDCITKVFFKILPHLQNVEIIEIVSVDYEAYLYDMIKSLTQNRENKIKIRIRNEYRNEIPKEENDKFIIEEWSMDDYEKIHVNLF